MPAKSRPTGIPENLKDRMNLLRANLLRLSSAQFVLVTIEPGTARDHSPRIEIRSRVRIRKTGFYFDIWEDFRDFDINPILYGFKYSLRPQPDPESEPLFRYECHPDAEDPSVSEDSEDEGEDKELGKQNPYGVGPHFHPHTTLEHPISRLHYPFHRRERMAVVFALIAWIETDLVVRFYDSGRIKSS